MFMIAATGGREEPIFRTFDNWEKLVRDEMYKNVEEYVRYDNGERVDILELSPHNEPVIRKPFVGDMNDL